MSMACSMDGKACTLSGEKDGLRDSQESRNAFCVAKAARSFGSIALDVRSE